MQRQCQTCGKELTSLVPWQCKRCGNYYCGDHRLPEKHNCIASPKRSSMKDWKKQQEKFREHRDEDRIYTPKKSTYHKDNSHRRYKKEPREYHKKRRRPRQYTLWQTIRYKFRRAKVPFWMYIIILMIVIAIVNIFYEVKILSIDITILFYILEIILISIVMFKILIKLDSIYVDSDLRLFGLRILSGLVSFIGFIILFYFVFFAPIFSLIDRGMYNAVFFGSLINLPYLGYFIYIVVSFSLIIIGAYLFFKFQRRTGQIVWFGRFR
jgi:hypothetical protein